MTPGADPQTKVAETGPKGRTKTLLFQHFLPFPERVRGLLPQRLPSPLKRIAKIMAEVAGLRCLGDQVVVKMVVASD